MHKKIMRKSSVIIISAMCLFLVSLCFVFSGISSLALAENNDALAEESLTTTFDANGGVFADGSISITLEQTVGSNYKLPESNPTNGEYIFTGWYTKKDGGSKISSDTKVLQTVHPNAYAHWEKLITFNVNGSLGHWCFLRHYVDMEGKEQYDELYNWQEEFPVGTTLQVDKSTGKLFMLNLTSKLKVFMYDIIPVSYANFPIQEWWYDGARLEPGMIYKIEDKPGDITVTAHYDYSKDGVPVAINSNEGISTFHWETYIDGNFVTSGEVFPLKDISIVGSTLLIDENGTFTGSYLQPENNMFFSETIKPVIKEGYKFVGAQLSDGTKLQLNKEYTLTEEQSEVNIVYLCEKIASPQENITETIYTTPQTYDNNQEAIISILTIALFGLCIWIKKLREINVQ